MEGELLPPGGQLLGPIAFLRAAWAAARHRHGVLACLGAMVLLAPSTAPALAAVALVRRLRPDDNLASRGLSFLLRTFPGSLLTRSHFDWEHLPPDGAVEPGFGRAARFVRAWLALAGERWVDEERGQPLAMDNRPNLHAPSGDHLVVSCEGRLFRVAVGPTRALAGAFEAIQADPSAAEPGPGVLTTGPRGEWWRRRRALMASETNRDSIAAVEQAAAFVALDPSPDGPLRRDRHRANRWLDRAVQIVASPDGTVDTLVDHAAADGHDYGRFAERLRAREAATGKDDDGPDAVAVTPLRWDPGLAVEASPADRFEAGVASLPALTADAVRGASASPDAVCQLLLHRAFFLAEGRLPAGEACVVHRRRYRGGRYTFAHVGTPEGDAWMATGRGLRAAGEALVARLTPLLPGPDLCSTLFAVAGLQAPGPMPLRAAVRRASDSLTLRIPPLRTAFYPELVTSNMSGLPGLGRVGPVTQRPGGLAAAHRIGPAGARFDLWWSGSTPSRRTALIDALEVAAGEAAAELGLA